MSNTLLDNYKYKEKTIFVLQMKTSQKLNFNL